MHDAITRDDRHILCEFINSTDRYTQGEKVKEFEKQWSEWLGSKYSLMVTSGSTANLLLLAAVKELFNVPNGSKVLVPACTWVTNVSPVIQLGLEPVFCDINLNNFSFDTDSLPDEDIKIIFITYLLGFDSPHEKLKEKYPNALIIEDICESHGVTDANGVKRGSDSLGGTFSFYYGHHMTTVEGGMISTNNKQLYDLMKLKRSHGMARNLDPEEYTSVITKYPNIDPQFLFLTDGYNFRSTELNAVLGIQQLKRLDRNIEIRKKNYKMFLDILKKFEEHFYIPSDSETNSSFSFPLVCRDARMLRNLKFHFKDRIEYRPIVAGNLLVHPFLDKWKDVRVPNATILNNNGVYIGNNQNVTEKMLKTLEDILLNAIGTGVSG